MPAPANLVHQTTSDTGTGNLALSAVNGKQAFATAFTSGTANEFDYFISNRNAAEWERGTGHVTAGSLVRDTVIESTNANAAVNFSAGTKDVVNDVPAAKQVTTDTAQSITGVKTLTLTNCTGLPSIIVADEATDTTCFPAFFTAATGELGPKTNANLTYNSSTSAFANNGPLDLSGAAAGQIKFPASQNTSSDANTLDDYEEGTFTPALSATGATFSYSTQSGHYTKVGNLVWFHITILMNTSGNTLTGNAISLTGLPFTSSAGPSGVRCFCGWANSTTSYVQVLLAITSSATTGVFTGNTAAATANNTSLLANGLCHATNGTQLRITGVYQA